jgi:hypothetical protein
MSVNFSEAKCQCITENKLFGICDDPPPPQKQAYIDEEEGAKWIAVVVNEDKQEVTFTAIDNCIEIRSKNGKMAKRCDGVLTFDSTIAFVELKERDEKGNKWVKDAEKQLRSTISCFEESKEAENYKIKRAYIANRDKPKFKVSQKDRMDQFLLETGYVLRIENRIILD